MKREYVENIACEHHDCGGRLYQLNEKSEPEKIQYDVRCERCHARYMRTKDRLGKVWVPANNQEHIDFAIMATIQARKWTDVEGNGDIYDDFWLDSHGGKVRPETVFRYGIDLTFCRELPHTSVKVFVNAPKNPSAAGFGS